MKSKYFAVLISVIFLFSLTFVSGTDKLETKIDTTSNINNNPISLISNDIETNIGNWYEEQINLWVDPSGYYWSSAGFRGYPLNFGSLNTADYDPNNLFLWGGVSTWQTESPWDKNVKFDLVFRTNNPSEAEAAAQQMVNEFNSIVAFDVYFDHSSGEDWWGGNDNQWEQITRVVYEGHVDWTNMQNVIDQSVPRNKGGLAETIDVYPAESLEFWMWNQGDGTLGAEIKVRYNGRFDQSVGGHTLIINDIIHTTEIKKSMMASRDLNMWISLPDVTNPVLTPSNTSSTSLNWQYHPSSEPQNRYDAWTGTFSLFSTTAVYTNMSLTFDYEFIQESWINRDNYYWNIDPRGFDEISIESYGKERMKLTPNIGTGSALTQDLVHFNFEYDDFKEELSVGFVYQNYGNRDADIANIYDEINQSLGIDLYVNSWNWSNTADNWWDWRNNVNINVSIFYVYKNMTSFNYENIVKSTYGYNRSAFLGNTSLVEMRNFSFKMFEGTFGLYGVMRLSYSDINDINKLGSAIPSSFDRLATSYILDLYNPNHLGWTNGLPWNNFTEEARLNVNGPFLGNFTADLNFSVDTNNGIAWDSWRGSSRDNRINYFNYNVNLYTLNPQETNKDGSVIGPITAFQVDVNYDFHDWDFDFEAPWSENLRWRDTAYPDTSFNDNNAWRTDSSGIDFTGVVDVVAKIHDTGRGGQYESSFGVWEPKFPGSGISEVNVTLFRTDAPIDNPRFKFSYPMIFNSTWGSDSEAWTSSIDTSLLPDGEWEVWSETSDNSNNYGRSGQSIVTLKNYVGTSNATFDTSDLPLDYSSVSDIVYLNWSITDDLESFVTVIWMGLGGYIVDPVSVIDNGDGTFTQYFEFKFDTIFEIENRDFAYFIETLDMNGNWVQSNTYHVKIDNVPSGNPPTIVLNNHPVANSDINASETPSIIFSATVLDDIGIEKVVLHIGTFSFNMDFNSTSGDYESVLDITTWNPGQYNWYIEVRDADENVHIINSPVMKFTIVGNAPVVVDSNDPEISLISPATGSILNGSVTFVVEATDDFGVENVVAIFPDESEKVMKDDGSNKYSIDFNTADLADGTYEITFKVTDKSGKTASILVSFVFENGRTEVTPELGVPGFELYIAILSILIVLPIIKRKRN